jgi:hypothetical protein
MVSFEICVSCVPNLTFVKKIFFFRVPEENVQFKFFIFFGRLIKNVTFCGLHFNLNLQQCCVALAKAAIKRNYDEP